VIVQEGRKIAVAEPPVDEPPEPVLGHLDPASESAEGEVRGEARPVGDRFPQALKFDPLGRAKEVGARLGRRRRGREELRAQAVVQKAKANESAARTGACAAARKAGRSP